MSKAPKKSPTIFYWLSLISSVAVAVLMFVPWFLLRATSFGIYNDSGVYTLTQIPSFLKTLTVYVKVSSDTWVSTVAVAAMYGVAALFVIHIIWTLITIRRTPPRGIIPAVAALLTTAAFFVIQWQFSGYIQTNLPPDFAHIDFFPTITPFLVVAFTVASVVFSLLNRQESRALYAVQHPQEIVFPPENPEPV